MSCSVNPASGPSSPVDLLPDLAPGGELGEQSPGWLTWSPDSVPGVISSGIRCARTFCEHLTALYAVECSRNTHEGARARLTARFGTPLAKEPHPKPFSTL